MNTENETNNKVTLLGNINPKNIEFGSNGRISFSVAINQGKDKDGNQKPTNWINCVSFAKEGSKLHTSLQEAKENSVSKQAFFNGQLKNSTYFDGKGERKFSSNVVVNNIAYNDRGFEAPKTILELKGKVSQTLDIKKYSNTETDGVTTQKEVGYLTLETIDGKTKDKNGNEKDVMSFHTIKVIHPDQMETLGKLQKGNELHLKNVMLNNGMKPVISKNSKIYSPNLEIAKTVGQEPAKEVQKPKARAI